MDEKINKILTRGVIIKYTFDKINMEYDDVVINKNPNLLEGIKSLLDSDEEFFLISRASNLDFIETTYKIVNQYRKQSKKDTDKINYIIRKLNGLSKYDYNIKDVEEYVAYDMVSRGIITDQLEDITYAMLYDAVIYCALVNNEFNIDNNEAIISSTNYFLHNIPEIYENENIYQNALIMIDSVIKDSLPLTNIRKVAKYTKESIGKKRIHE